MRGGSKKHRFVRAGALVAAVALVAIAIPMVTLSSDPAMRGDIPHHVPHGPGLGVDADAIAERVRAAAAAGESVEALYGSSAGLDQVLQRLAVQPQDVIVDLGTGTGRLEMALLERGIPFRAVHALDIDPAAIELLDRVLDASGLRERGRVELRVSQPDDIGLPPSSVDVVLLLNTPVFLQEPGEPDHVWREKQACLASIARALAPGGRLHVYEYPFKIAQGTGSGDCGAIADAFEPLGFREVNRDKLRLVWWAPRFPRHCWVELEKPASTSDRR